MNEKNIALAKNILRFGMSFCFVYVAVSAWLSPQNWSGFIPLFARNIVPESFLLYIHAGFDLLLGLWLLTNKKIFYASILSALNLLVIIIFNFGSLDIIFRDIGLLAAAISLALLSRER